MRKITRAAAALALAVGATTMVTATSANAAPADGTVHGCQAGAFCIYPQDAGWNNDQPSQLSSAFYAPNSKDRISWDPKNCWSIGSEGSEFRESAHPQSANPHSGSRVQNHEVSNAITSPCTLAFSLPLTLPRHLLCLPHSLLLILKRAHSNADTRPMSPSQVLKRGQTQQTSEDTTRRLDGVGEVHVRCERVGIGNLREP